MVEHLSEHTIELYRQQQIDMAERRRTDAHLATCEDCLKRLLNGDHSVIAGNALREAFLPSVDETPFHLSDAELSEHLDGSATKADQIICESHLADCVECEERMRLLGASQPLRKFDSQAQTRKWKFLQPWQAVTVAVALLGILLLALVFWRQSPRSIREVTANHSEGENQIASPPANPAQAATPNIEDKSDTSNQSVLSSLKDNGREIQLNEEGTLTGLDEFDDSAKRMVKAALAGEGFAKPEVLEDLKSPPIKLLGDPPSETTFELIAPVGRVVADGRPTFRWQPFRGATNYVISVFDENFNRIARSPALSNTKWTITTPLHRGRTYSWEVTATKDSAEVTAPITPAPRAEFRILEAEKVSELRRLERQSRVSHFALGLAYMRFGLLTEAEGEFRQLVKENPNSVLAKKLLRTVQQWQNR
jgi:hypothetical protein